MAMFWSDLRYSFRQLRKSPGFTLTVLITLGLCIGANTAIYSVVDAVLLRPLPYPEPERLAMVSRHIRSPRGEGNEFGQNGTVWEAVRDHASDLDAAATSGGTSGVNLAAAGQVQYVRQARVSAGYFHVLGIAPQQGREFTRVEDTRGGAAVAILTYQLWQRVFHTDPSVVGKAINLRGEPFTVVGIMPREFPTLSPVDLWTPLRASSTGEGSGTNYEILARVKPGLSWAAANAQLEVIGQAAISSFHFGKDVSMQIQLASLQRGLTNDMRSSLLPVWVAAMLVLLIGCVNIAGLLLARAGARRREIATRMAVGASRGALMRQLLTESVLLALAGGAIGVLLGNLGIEALDYLGAGGFGLWRPITIDSRVLMATLVIALFTSLLFGLLPALETSRLDIRSVLIEGGRGGAGGRRRWSRQALIVVEVALGVVLLVSAGLMIRTFAYLSGQNPGFDPRHVFTAQLSLQDARYRTSAAVNKLFEQSLSRIRQLPGVESAAVGLTLPYQRPLNGGFEIADGVNKGNGYGTDIVYVTPGYFETLRMQLLRGRRFRDSDRADSQSVAIVNEAFAQWFLKNQDAVGSHLKSGKDGSEIVGVVASVVQKSGLGNSGPLGVSPTLYVPAAQTTDAELQMIHTWFSPSWVVRMRGSEQGLAAQMQDIVESIDPQLPFASFHTISELELESLQGQRYHAVLFSVFAGLALLLAALGVYGLIAQSVTQRTREIGIRMALGASLRDAMVSIVQPGVRLSLLGIGAGVLLALFATKLLKSLVWGVRTADATTFVVVATMLLLVSISASVLPALRLTRLDPAKTLREE